MSDVSENDTSREVEVLGSSALPMVHEITEPTTGALQRLEAEALAMDKAFKIAKGLSATAMVPEHFQRSFIPKGCQEPLGDAATWDLCAAILYGAELGLSAVQSAQNIFVVHGKPAVYARTMAAQVRRAGFRIEEVEANDTCVIWRGQRDGHWASSEWTIERADKAGYLRNDRYTTNPTEMLRAKAIAEVCRIQYQDVLLGMAYTVEELQLDSVTVQRVVKKEGTRGTAKLREIAEAASAQTSDDPQVDAQAENAADAGPVEGDEQADPQAQGAIVVDPECVSASPEQVERIRALYKAQGLSAAEVLDEVTVYLQLDKRLTALSKLAAADAAGIIANLTQPEDGVQETGDG
jgi:hypothetical protein